MPIGLVSLQVTQGPWHQLANVEAFSAEKLPVAGLLLLAVAVAIEQMGGFFVRKDDVKNVEALVE